MISRQEAAALGRQAVAIIEAGAYEAPSGRRVELTDRIALAVAASYDVPPSESVSFEVGSFATKISVVNGSTLASAARLVDPLVLNFASAHKPGGGFLSGARAQEESLARASTLYPCLLKSGMYEHHRFPRDPMYTSWMIVSPHVTVFRDDAGALLEEPYDVAFLTAPAPNAGVVLEREPHRREEVREVMAERVHRVLAVAARAGYRRPLLGAWGCGVFQNDPSHVAACFRRELDESFAGTFEEIVFAILDWSEERRFITPFEAQFL